MSRSSNIFTREDDLHMQNVFLLAQQAYAQDEVPVGAVLLAEDGQVFHSFNQREALSLPYKHAEFLAIELACQRLNTWRLPGSTLYVSIEPCLMCTGLIYQTRIDRVVFSAKNPKGGSLCFIHDHEQKLNINHHLIFDFGLMKTESIQLLKSFFSEKRENQVKKTIR